MCVWWRKAMKAVLLLQKKQKKQKKQSFKNVLSVWCLFEVCLVGRDPLRDTSWMAAWKCEHHQTCTEENNNRIIQKSVTCACCSLLPLADCSFSSSSWPSLLRPGSFSSSSSSTSSFSLLLARCRLTSQSLEVVRERNRSSLTHLVVELANALRLPAFHFDFLLEILRVLIGRQLVDFNFVCQGGFKIVHQISNTVGFIRCQIVLLSNMLLPLCNDDGTSLSIRIKRPKDSRTSLPKKSKMHKSKRQELSCLSNVFDAQQIQLRMRGKVDAELCFLFDLWRIAEQVLSKQGAWIITQQNNQQCRKQSRLRTKRHPACDCVGSLSAFLPSSPSFFILLTSNDGVAESTWLQGVLHFLELLTKVRPLDSQEREEEHMLHLLSMGAFDFLMIRTVHACDRKEEETTRRRWAEVSSQTASRAVIFISLWRTFTQMLSRSSSVGGMMKTKSHSAMALSSISWLFASTLIDLTWRARSPNFWAKISLSAALGDATMMLKSSSFGQRAKRWRIVDEPILPDATEAACIKKSSRKRKSELADTCSTENEKTQFLLLHDFSNEWQTRRNVRNERRKRKDLFFCFSSQGNILPFFSFLWFSFHFISVSLCFLLFTTSADIVLLIEDEESHLSYLSFVPLIPLVLIVPTSQTRLSVPSTSSLF